MKLLLCSEGFHTANTVQACVDLVGKPQDEIKIAIINEAFAVEQGDKRWVIDNLNDVVNNFSGEVDIINLLALPLGDVKLRLMSSDVIFVVGGNTDYLMFVFKKTGFDKLLPELLETKVYVGSSAGSVIAGRRVSNKAYQDMYGEDNNFGISGYLELVDFAVKPHMDSDHFTNNRPDLLEKVTKDYHYPVYGLRDDSALIVNGDTVTVIGSDPYRYNV